MLYVSPLKALGNDIQKNLEAPLGEILHLAAERGLMMPEIRTAVRTGDTLMHERQKMLKRPPHILVTTPESLYILLTAEKSRAHSARCGNGDRRRNPRSCRRQTWRALAPLARATGNTNGKAASSDRTLGDTEAD